MERDKKLDFSVDKLTEEHIKEIEKHAGFDQANITEHYDDLSTNYEDIYLKVGWPDPMKCAELVEACQPDVTISKEHTRILDMGCGTGLVGQYLKEKGFDNIDGQDASQGMLENAKKKGAYKELDKLFLGSPTTYPEKYHG